MRKKDSTNFLKINNFVFTIFLIGIAITVAFLVIIFVRTPPSYYEYTGFTLGTYCRIVVSSKKGSKNLAQIIFNELNRVYKKFDPNNSDSVISKINASGDWVDLDEESFVLIDAAMKFSQITEGAFDPALGNLIKLWGFDKIAQKVPTKVPSQTEIDEILKHCGIGKVELDSRTRRVKLNDGVKLDLGGIAKGYALDRACQIAKEIDPKCTGFVEVGGDIRILGPKFGSRPWVIGVRDPRKPDLAVTYIYLTDGAVATSGDYERYFIVDGLRYHHIFDPRTGYPATGAQSVTVIAKDATTADVLSTSGFVMAQEWEYVVLEYSRLGGSVLLISEDGTIHKSPSFLIYERPK